MGRKLAWCCTSTSIPPQRRLRCADWRDVRSQHGNTDSFDGLHFAVPVTPPSGQKTYRAEAVVNPAVDADTVNLVWSVPTELPAYAAATLAEELCG